MNDLTKAAIVVTIPAVIAVANAVAFLGESGPTWKWIKEGNAGYHEWDWDANGRAQFVFTWFATIADIAFPIWALSVWR